MVVQYVKSACRIVLASLMAVFMPCSLTAAQTAGQLPIAKDQQRIVDSPGELHAWLENMYVHHKFSFDEISAVTGMPANDVPGLLQEHGITQDPAPRPNDRMLVLPYPGGRHPRIGFLDGAIAPQRETKLSVFCPWDSTSYAVMDVPEAIWSNLGLTYLAHTHIDTVWSKQGVGLKQLEWEKQGHNYSLVRTLPNGIEFGVKVIPLKDHVRMKMWLTNGTDNLLTDLRVQNCVMLGGVAGFTQQTNDNKQYTDGYAIGHSQDKSRWIISGWDPIHRTWGNKNCPCLHSDPKFDDCPPGETRWLRGWFSFYEGDDIKTELARIEATGWRTHPLHHVTGNLVGKVVDANSRAILPSRVYVQDIETGEYHFARSTAVAGSAVPYDKQMGRSASIERHTCLSADGFQLDVPPGKYLVTASHGKEYSLATQEVTVGEQRENVELEIQGFVDMPSLGWYSGDTHVHRSMDELPTAMLAEDLNVALPLNYWVRDSRETPSSQGEIYAPAPIEVDATHVIYPINTEYEIFTVDGKRHTQGAVFVLNHRRPLQLTAPPVTAIAQVSREQNALLDLDKHSWNWSLMAIPVMGVDLFELSNNHHWKTGFGFSKWTVENAPPDWPLIERVDDGFTEKGWTHFGFETYYRLLNCGFRLRVSAGNASGVHPVPLGHGRVYVHTGSSFSYQSWISGLDQGHSFVTQGPLLDVRFNDALPGTTWKTEADETAIRVTGTIDSQRPITSAEIVRNGVVISTIDVQPELTASKSYRVHLDETISIAGSGWLALRCFEQPAKNAPAGKIVFAHTNPVFVDSASGPLEPRPTDAQYFFDRMTAEIERNRGILSPSALDEYRQAKQIYGKLLGKAK